MRKRTVPPPYSYDGAADCWCVTGRLVASEYGDKIISSHKGLEFNQGFDPVASVASLSGLSVFSGGGSFDRGLEEGGSVNIRWAVEMAKEPMHTYRANLKDVSDTALYLGSVNDYLQTCLEGKHDPQFEPAPFGDVDFISAGSPCKGFSRSNPNPTSNKALGYASLVASVLSFINAYCPYYLVLENVIDMYKSGGKDSKENVFSQVIATLVSMGYQTQTNLTDSWSHGSSQMRSRLFVVAAAPGLQLPERPPQTHLHPPQILNRAMGKTNTGANFGVRHLNYDCPFDYVSAQEASYDLPIIGDGSVRTVVPFPDHRLSGREGAVRAFAAKWIPRFPRRSRYISAVKAGKMPQSIQQFFRQNRSAHWQAETSKAYMRMAPNQLWPTIRTANRPDDCRYGHCLHWDDPRTMTLMEARRAQSVPDHEVLIGNVLQQWLVVGNGVDRKASVAMGVSLREAFLDSQTQSIIQGHKSILDGSFSDDVGEERYSTSSP